MEIEKYLPLGTVVLLKNGKKRIMITGFAATANNDKSTVYDYIGCLFPEGVLSSNQNIVFNHNQISDIYFIGYIDEEQKSYNLKLKEFMEKKN